MVFRDWLYQRRARKELMKLPMTTPPVMTGDTVDLDNAIKWADKELARRSSETWLKAYGEGHYTTTKEEDLDSFVDYAVRKINANEGNVDEED